MAKRQFRQKEKKHKSSKSSSSYQGKRLQGNQELFSTIKQENKSIYEQYDKMKQTLSKQNEIIYILSDRIRELMAHFDKMSLKTTYFRKKFIQNKVLPKKVVVLIQNNQKDFEKSEVRAFVYLVWQKEKVPMNIEETKTDNVTNKLMNKSFLKDLRQQGDWKNLRTIFFPYINKKKKIKRR